MHVARAVFAGVAGALAMTVASLVFGELGIVISLENFLGALLGFEAGSEAGWIAGFVLHLIVGGWIAVVYACGFEDLTQRAGWSVGAVFSMVHILIAGFVVAFAAFAVPQESTQAAMFMAQSGLAGVCAFMLMHLLYGAVVGTVYAITLTPHRIERHDRYDALV